MHTLRAKTSALAAAGLLIITGLSACGSTEHASSTTTTAAAPTSFPATVHASNGDVVIPARPARIVSLSPTATEDLFATGARQQVVAVDSLSNFPVDAPKTDLSGFKPYAEAVLAYKPDLVVASYDANGLVAALQAAQIPVLVEPSATSLEDAYDQIEDLGDATGNSLGAQKVTGDIRHAIAKAVAETPKHQLRIYHEADPTFYSAASSSFIGQIYSLFGLQNIADASANGNPFPQLSAESIIKANPDVIFLADATCCGQSTAAVTARPGWSTVSAVQHHAVVDLGDDVASRWGPRITDLVNEIANAVRSQA